MRKPTLEIKGEKELIRKLKRLGDKRKMKRVLRRATTASAQIVVKSVRKFWPTDSGLSKKSVTKKVISTRSGYSGIIGIDKEVVGEVHGRPHVPSNIDHLIEFGWQTPEGRTVPAVAPLRRGYDAAKHEAEARFASKAAEEIEKEVAKR